MRFKARAVWPRPGRDRPALPDAVGRDPLDGDRRPAHDHQARPARADEPGRREDRQGPVRAARLGPLHVLGAPAPRPPMRIQVTRPMPSARRNASSRSATGGLTVETAHHDSPGSSRLPVGPGGRPGRRIIQRQRDRLGQPAGLVEPAPLEPRVPQVGDDAEHGLNARDGVGDGDRRTSVSDADRRRDLGDRRPRAACSRTSSSVGCLQLAERLDDPVEELRDAPAR